jgi:hypothetical protein
MHLFGKAVKDGGQCRESLISLTHVISEMVTTSIGWISKNLALGRLSVKTILHVLDA